MIEENNTVSRELEQAQNVLEQAKARLAKAKSKEAERRRKEDTHKKIILGGIVKKYFPDCMFFDEIEIVICFFAVIIFLVFDVICSTKNQMVMDMTFIDMGGQNIVVFSL